MADQDKPKENEYKKEMTAEEKKNQRQAKAALKKAKAEAAIAKKAAQPPPALKETGKGQAKTGEKIAPGKQPEKSKEEKKSDEVLVNMISNIQITSSPITPVKSALKDFSSEDAKCSDADKAPEEYQPYSPVPKDVHHAFTTLVTRCDNNQITTVDQLTIEFLYACKTMFSDFLTNNFEVSKKFERSPLALLSHQVNYLVDNGKWLLPPALNNIYRMVNRELQKIDEHLTQDETAEMIADELDVIDWTHFTPNESPDSNITCASKDIRIHLENKLKQGQTVVVYTGNKLIEEMADDLLKKQISIIVCDDECVLTEYNSPAYMLAKTLSSKGIPVRYTDIKGIAYVLPMCDLAILPSSAVFLNGGVFSPRGSHQLALLAKHFNVPVVVCAQTYKFVDLVYPTGRTALLRRQNDEIVPPEYVTAIVTEMRLIPPSSSPAVVKSKMGDL